MPGAREIFQILWSKGRHTCFQGFRDNMRNCRANEKSFSGFPVQVSLSQTFTGLHSTSPSQGIFQILRLRIVPRTSERSLIVHITEAKCSSLSSLLTILPAVTWNLFIYVIHNSKLAIPIVANVVWPRRFAKFGRQHQVWPDVVFKVGGGGEEGGEEGSGVPAVRVGAGPSVGPGGGSGWGAVWGGCLGGVRSRWGPEGREGGRRAQSVGGQKFRAFFSSPAPHLAKLSEPRKPQRQRPKNLHSNLNSKPHRPKP